MAIYYRLYESKLLHQMKRIPFMKIDRASLLLVHPESHISKYYHDEADEKQMQQLEKQKTKFFGDNYMNKFTRQAASLSAGAVVDGIDAIMSGKCDRAFCLIRPPGHHSNEDCSRGFCFFNNIAIAARCAQKKWGLKRICIFDWDVHHGDGTEQIFLRDPNVLFVSLHRYDEGLFYPGTGTPTTVGMGEGEGYNINVGW